MTFSLRFRAAIVSIALLAAFLVVWPLATRGTSVTATLTPEYATLMGLTATHGKSPMPAFKNQLKPFEIEALADYIKMLPPN